MGTRVNSSSIFAGSAAATAYTTTLGVAALAGDLIVVAGGSNGTHAANGMSVKDSVNNVNFPTILEIQGTSGSSRWMQVFAYATPVNLASGTTLTFTPYAASTLNSFAADIFRGYTATQVATATSYGNPTASALKPTGPAFAAAPAAGSLIVSYFETALSTPFSVASPYTIGSNGSTDVDTGVAYVLSADGSLTYSAVWTQNAVNGAAVVDAAFTASVGIPSGFFSAVGHPGPRQF